MERQCLRIPIRTGSTERVVQWIRSLQDRTDEIATAIASEGITAESVFLERSNNGDTLLIYTVATDLVAANQAFQASTIAIDVEFRALMA
ncbi:hypothetical protein H6F89_20625 [Cyanobacteria bacterium FACHB-63]|nr:hypothetical protein [Cyanobacteria bacterium FACHB-63]